MSAMAAAADLARRTPMGSGGRITVVILSDCQGAITLASSQLAYSERAGMVDDIIQSRRLLAKNGMDVIFEQVPSHGKRPNWTPKIDLESGFCREMNQKADEAATACLQRWEPRLPRAAWFKERDLAIKWAAQTLRAQVRALETMTDHFRRAYGVEKSFE